MSFKCSCSCSHTQFFAAFQVVAPLQDTCIEIYSVDGDRYTKQVDIYLYQTFDSYTYTSDVSTNMYSCQNCMF